MDEKRSKKLIQQRGAAMKNIEESVTLEIGGATLTIATRELLRAWMDKHLESKPVASQSINMPKLNDGEIYAGAIINPDGTGHHVILLDGANHRTNWNDQLAWAKSIGGDLPTSGEWDLIFNNNKGKLSGINWINDTRDIDCPFGWVIDIDSGIHVAVSRHGNYMARAVRRLEI